VNKREVLWHFLGFHLSTEPLPKGHPAQVRNALLVG